jgi:type IV pilus assembly protein PilB
MTDPELDDRLAELLQSHHVLESAALARARSFQEIKHCTLAGALMSLQLVSGDLLSSLLEELTGARAVDPTLMTVHPEFIERVKSLIPPEVIHALVAFPAQMEVNRLHVCVINPTDARSLRALEAISGCRITPVVSHEAVLTKAIEQHFGRWLPSPPRYGQVDAQAVVDRAYRELLETPFETFVQPAIAVINRQRDAMARDAAAVENVARDPAVVRLVQQILCRAIEAGGSDVHVEPIGDQLRVRVRVDGAMRLMHVLPASAAVPVTARLKIMAELPMASATTPLDGRIGYDLVLGRGIDLRFSLVPAITGEKIVLRVLDRTRERRQLGDLGVDAHTQARLEQAADLPNGLILVTGPTGSGKSSTLYALLERLNREDASLVTAEDPVESQMPGVTQVQCAADGLTYATALKSFLRQDPDVMMVGEIRDPETADIALKAALTGHLVLSTLHTNDASGAVLRLVNMNIEPFVIASSLRLVVAQRLIRRLCANCKIPMALDELPSPLTTAIASLERHAGAIRLFRPAGCPTCSGAGYRGRTGIFETLGVTPAIEDLILGRPSVAALRAAARAEGMRTLRDAALLKFMAGDTSLAEVLEHTIADEPLASVTVPEMRAVAAM